MDKIRNSIIVSGLADPAELPGKNVIQVLHYSETETIFIPEQYPEATSIFQIMINLDIKSTDNIKTPAGVLTVVDGSRKFKIIYTSRDESGRANFLDVELPFNAFLEMPPDCGSENIKIYVLDAYFSLTGERKIYSHMLFTVNVTAFKTNTENLNIVIPEEIVQRY